MPNVVSVFCSSSAAVVPRYGAAAEELGELIAARGWTLLYGGEDIGLMGVLARSAKRRGGHVIGVVTKFMKDRELVNFNLCDEITVVRSFAERKAVLIEQSALYVALPGGFGTLDEAFEVIHLRQIGSVNKPLFFINVEGYFNDLRSFFSTLAQQGFCPTRVEDLVCFVSSVQELAPFLEEAK